jgi:hypothetical protein
MKKLIAVTILAAVLISAQAAFSLTVSISPQLIDMDTVRSFNVAVKDASDFGAFEFTLKYDPNIVTIETVTLGDFIEKTDRTANELIDNKGGGTLKYAVYTEGDAAGPNGEGILAEIAFSLKVRTETPLIFDDNYSYIIDSKAEVLFAQWVGGKITDVCKINAGAGSCGTITPSGDVFPECGTDMTFTINSDACHTIADVKVNGVSVGAVGSYTFRNIQGNDNTISAECISKPPYIITAGAGTGGKISLSGDIPVNCGGNQTFTISPDSCYHISDVKVDGLSVGAVSSYEFRNVTANHSIYAEFAKNQCKITSSATPSAGGSILPYPDVVVACGEDITFTIKPNPNYQIVDVVRDGISVKANVQMNADGSGSYTFKKVVCSHNETVHNIDAIFDNISYVITPSVEVVEAGVQPAGGKIEPSQPVTVAKGSDKEFIMTPNPCYEISDVTVDGISAMKPIMDDENLQIDDNGVGTYTFKNVTENHELIIPKKC